jgi:hypothetical protein
MEKTSPSSGIGEYCAICIARHNEEIPLGTRARLKNKCKIAAHICV